MILYLAGIGQSIQDEMDLIENADSYNRLHSFLDGERVLQAIHYSEKLRGKKRKKKHKRNLSLSLISTNTRLTHEMELEEIQKKVHTIICQIKTNMFDIGKLLSRAKEILRHGNFQKWIEDTFKEELPYITAYNYMRIYETFPDRPDVVQMLPFNFLQDITSKEFPEIIRELVTDKDNLEITKRSDIRKIRNAYQDFKSGITSKKEFENDVREELMQGREATRIRKPFDVNKAKDRFRLHVVKTLNAYKTIEQNIDSIEVFIGTHTVDKTEIGKIVEDSRVDLSRFIDGIHDLNVFEASDYIMKRVQGFKGLLGEHSENGKPLVNKVFKKRRT